MKSFLILLESILIPFLKSFYEFSFLDIEKEENDREWLQQNVVHQYWKGETACLPTKLDGGSVFGESQMFNTLQVSLLERNVTKMLTEATFVRETLWMLQGIETTFVYR